MARDEVRGSGAGENSRRPPAPPTRDPHDILRLVLGVGLLLGSAQPIDPERVGGLEEAIFHLVNDLPGVLFPVVWVVMQIGALAAIPAVVLLAWVKGRHRLALDMAVAGTLAYLLAKVMKRLIPRGRPGDLLHDLVLHGAPAAGTGYISGHAALAAALATAASPYLSRRGRVISWLLVGGVMFGRVYAGSHLPLDVLGGAGLGVALGSLVHVCFGAPPVQHRELWLHRLARRKRSTDARP
jgi:membrane-associated phospholipid phosphatase